MAKKEVATVTPLQVRIPPELREGIDASAERCFRTIHSEVLYRLKLLDDLVKKGDVVIQ